MRLSLGTDFYAPEQFALTDALRKWGAVDYGRRLYGDGWVISGNLGLDRVVPVGEFQDSTHQSRVFAVVSDRTSEQVVRGDEVRPTALLPVEVKLPEARGWVVASLPRAQLRYRTTADGLWQSTTVDAALLPEALEVTRPGEAPEVVRMTG